MSKSPFFSFILLDRSGSMESCRDAAIDAINEYMMGLRRSDALDARISLAIFDSESIDLIQSAEPAKSSLELSRANYTPRASTPLLDAIGRAVAEIDKVALRAEEKVGLVILTDGLENASKEHTKDSINKLLRDRQDNRKWLVTFLGAEVDAFADAHAIGVGADQYLALKKGKLRQSMHHTAAAQSRYVRSGEIASAAFTSEERKDADTV